MNAEAKAAPRSKRRGVLLLIAAVAAVGFGGYRYYQFRKPYEWSGTVEARTISVGSRAGGRVKQVLVREGDRVAAGQPLILLEPGDWPAQLVQAEAQLALAEANLEKLENGPRPEEVEQARARTMNAKAMLAQTIAGSRPEQIAAAEARLKAQEATVERAKLDFERMRKLDETGSAARSDVDDSSTAMEAAIAQRDALAQEVAELKNGSRREELAQARAREVEQAASQRLIVAGARPEDVKAQRAQVESAKGKVDQIKTMIEELTVRAPSPARVEALDLRPGDIVASNATTAVLLEENQLYVRVYVPETLLGHVHVGQDVAIEVDSFPGEKFQGTVEHINGVGEFSPRNLQTADERADQVFASRVGLKTGFDRLRAGMAAFVTVPK